MTQIDPAKYVLLQGDIKPPFAYGTDPVVEASGQGMQVDDGQGNVTEQTTFFMYAVQSVKIAQPYANTARTNPPTPMKWDMGWTLTIGIYQTEEVAKAAVRAYYMGAFDAEDQNAINDPRLRNGRGAASSNGYLVRYRNLLLKIDTTNTSEVKSNRQPIDADLYYAAAGDADAHQQQLVASLARLWLDKVAGPERANLHVEAGEMWLRVWEVTPMVEREPVSDQQYVMVAVNNISDKVAAVGAEARLLLARQGDAEFQPVSRPVRLPDIPPSGWRPATFYWDLEGKNIEDAWLRVEVSIPGIEDADPADNQADLKCSIYTAKNADSAYRWVEDSYSFGNYGYNGREGQEMVEGILATVIGQVYTDPQAVTLLTRLMLPQTYTRLMSFLETSMQSGAGGHCYGMSATAGLYFLDASLRPGGGRTCDMTRDAASANINIYQRAQMVPIVQALLSGDEFFARNWGSLNCLNTVRTILKSDRKPVLISIAGSNQVQEQVMVNGQPQMQQVNKRWGHSLLAYKLVEVPGRNSAIYVYDPNIAPRGQWNGQNPSTAFSVNTADGTWGMTPNMTPLYGGVDAIAARAVTREVSLAEANAIVPVLKTKLAEMMAWLQKANNIMAVLRCPADVVFTDAQGRRVGHVNGAAVNEVPGAEIRSSGEVEIYVLPAAGQYSVQIAGTGAGESALDIIKPGGDGSIGIVSIGKLPTTAGAAFTGTLANGQMQRLSGGGADYGPTLVGSIAGDRVTWDVVSENATVMDPPQNPTRQTQGPVVTEPGVTLALSKPVICRSVENGEPVGKSTSFGPISEVWCYHSYTDLPVTTATCVWTRDGQEVTRSERQTGGAKGWFAFMLRTDAPDGLASGSYQVTTTAAGHVVQEQFTIKAVAGPDGNGPVTGQQGSVVICEAVQDGQPIGAATSFEPLPKVWCLARYTNQPATQAEYVCTLNGNEYSRLRKQITGSGSVFFAIRGANGGNLDGGAYQVTVSIGGRPFGSAAFTVGAAPVPVEQPGGAATTIDLTSRTASTPWTGQYPVGGGTLSLDFKCIQPGTIIDTVGIDAALVGDFTLGQTDDDKLRWQIFAPSVPGARRNGDGWHLFTSEATFARGQWHQVIATWGAGGVRLLVDGAVVVSDPVVLSLSGSAVFIGDYPGDNRFGDGYNIHRSMVGAVRNVQFTQ